jgi:MYXO-CTERM domain-containing protein
MQSRAFQVGLLLVAALVWPSAVSASISPVYSNGSLDTDSGTAFIISPSGGNQYEVSNSFVSTGSYNLTSIAIGVWEIGGTPSSFDWAIGTSPFLGDVASGTSSVPGSLSSASEGSDGAYSSFTSTLTISGSISAGTYYVTLKNAANTNSTSVYWDDNAGASTAQYRVNSGTPTNTPANVFIIYGNDVTTSSTPEPASLAIWGLGALGVAAVGRARRRKA